jgi:hypothetical protein
MTINDEKITTAKGAAAVTARHSLMRRLPQIACSVDATSADDECLRPRADDRKRRVHQRSHRTAREERVVRWLLLANFSTGDGTADPSRRRRLNRHRATRICAAQSNDRNPSSSAAPARNAECNYWPVNPCVETQGVSGQQRILGEAAQVRS